MVQDHRLQGIHPGDPVWSAGLGLPGYREETARCERLPKGRNLMRAARIEGMIPDATGVLSIIIMICAFMLSFANLQAGAVKAGITPWLAWAWPVCIDALLIAGSLMILRASLRKESTWFGWLVVFGFTGVSVRFNIAHSSSDLIGRATHAIPPITLMFSIEMFTMIIKSDLKHSVNVTSPAPVLSPVGDVTSSDVTEPEQKRKVTDEEVLQFFGCNTQASYIEASEALQVTRQTVGRKVAKLIEDGRMIRDGRELVVVQAPGWSPEVA